MFWKELHDAVYSALGLFVSNIRFTERETMAYLTEAQSVFQREAGLMEAIGTITIPANTGVVPYLFRWEPKQAYVHDDVNGIAYGIRDYTQWRESVDFLTPQPWVGRRTQPPAGTFTDPEDHLCAFQSRNFYIWPVPTKELVLTVRYKPLLTTISQSDAAWSAWFASDSAYHTLFTTTTPEREFFEFLNTGFVEFAVEKYMSGVAWDKGSAGRLKLAHDRWTAELDRAKKSKRLNMRNASTPYVTATSA